MAERNPTMIRLMDALRGARTVADIGCGDGGLGAALAKRGFDVIGVDPQADLIAIAKVRVPEARFVVATAEDMPIDDGSLDAVIMLNALHHLQEGAMDAGLKGGLRILKSGGTFVVVEPLAQGDFFRAMQPVDDETEIRAQALAAVARLKSAGVAALVFKETYEVARKFTDLANFLDYLQAAEPTRASQIAKKSDAVSASFSGNAVSVSDGYILTQPMSIWVFRKP